MNLFIAKYPTLWNMRKFIYSILLYSTFFNILYFYNYYHNYNIPLFFLILAVIGFFYFIEITDQKDKLKINDYDIFNELSLNPYKEYFIVLFLTVSFFITIIYSIYDINKKVTLSYNQIKTRLIILDKIYKDSNKTDENITTNNFKIKSNSFLQGFYKGEKEGRQWMENKLHKYENLELNILENAKLLKNPYFKYIISFFIVFTPLFFMGVYKEKGFYKNTFFINMWIFILLSIVFVYSNKVYFFLDNYKVYIFNYKYLLFVIGIFLILSFRGTYNIITKQEFKFNYDYYGIVTYYIGLFILFLTLNFGFKLNIVISTILLILLNIIFIKKLKEIINIIYLSPIQ